MASSVRDMIASKYGAKSLDVEDEDVLGDDTSPYNSVARAGFQPEPKEGEQVSPTSMGGMDAMDEYSRQNREGEREQNYISNLGRAFSMAAQGTNAPKDQGDFYSDMAAQNSAISKQEDAAMNRRAQVMRSIQENNAKRQSGQSEWDRRNTVGFEQKKEIAKILAGQRNAIREDMRSEKEGIRLEKAADKELSLAVPGLERTGEVLPKVEEAQKLRKASANAEQLSSKLKRLKQLVKDNGAFELGGEAGAEMESLATEIQLLAKNEDMYQLGVLTGPDMSLLQKITASPTSVDSLFTRYSTRQKQIDTQMKSITDKLDSTGKSMGYRKAGTGASSPDASGEVKVIGGVNYKKVPGGWQKVK